MKYSNPPSIQVKEKSGRIKRVKRYSVANSKPLTKTEAVRVAKSLRARGYKARLRRYSDGWWVFSNAGRII